MMEQEQPKRRKCGPRVKTGCITCRIRRVKCDEGKPECGRCVSTGRKCDGYMVPPKGALHRQQALPLSSNRRAVQQLSPLRSSPFEASDTQRDRQLFQFYCVKSALDLSVYLNSTFWHDIILQYSQHYGPVRHAVIAFGSSHLYAISMNQLKDAAEPNTDAIEQVQRYDKAIRSLRTYIETEPQPDPHAILICCALFFSCENSRGNREAAWQHLENGLHILNWWGNQQSNRVTHQEEGSDDNLQLVALRNGLKLKAKAKPIEIDEELVYLFSRLDVQATLCKEARKPVLDLAQLSKSSVKERLSQASIFRNITEAQRSLDYILNRLAQFLSTAPSSGSDPVPDHSDWESIDVELSELNKLCSTWEDCMQAFIADQTPNVRQNLLFKHAPNQPESLEWQLALQIQLLTLHHRCWRTLFRSYRDPTVFTMSPNPDAEETLDMCEFLAFALPLRPSPASFENDTDIAWKMISEISVTAPLYVAATKFTDETVRRRAIEQLVSLRENSNGMYHESFLDTVIGAIARQHQHPDPEFSFKTVFQDMLNMVPPQMSPAQLFNQLEQQTRHQIKEETDTDGSSTIGSSDKRDAQINGSGELLGWSKAKTLR